MFKSFFEKFSTFAHHHQALFAILIAFIIICMTWAVEKILDEHVFKNKRLQGYLAVIAGGLFVLWIIQHFVLHVM